MFLWNVRSHYQLPQTFVETNWVAARHAMDSIRIQMSDSVEWPTDPGTGRRKQAKIADRKRISNFGVYGPVNLASAWCKQFVHKLTAKDIALASTF
jgi:hypothetical protein